LKGSLGLQWLADYGLAILPVDENYQSLQRLTRHRPKSIYASEEKPLQEFVAKKRRGPQPIGDLLFGLLIRLGVKSEKPLESETSEALKS